MGHISYNYISLDIDKDINDPLTENEFEKLKRDGERFIEKVLEMNKRKFNPIKHLNEIYFSKNLRLSYILSLFIAILQMTFVFGFNESIESLYVLSGLAGVWLGIQALRFLPGYFKTIAEVGHFEISVRHYYRAHNSIVKKVDNYNDYIQMLNKSQLR